MSEHDHVSMPDVVAVPPRAKTPRGALSPIAAMADLTKGTAEEARRLLPVAASQGITTTIESLGQAIHWRKKGRTSARSAVPATVPAATVLKTIDAAIANLQAIRKTIAELEKDNRDLHLKIDGFRKLALK